MGWGCHPDILTIARCRGTANRTGHPPYSRDWRIAFRDAYAKAGGRDEPGLKEYLAKLDARIKEMAAEPINSGA